jgi:ribonuclease Z
MRLVLLGTGGYFPTDERHTACMMLPEAGVVLDAGTGMCGIGEYVCTDRLDIFLTHAHLDHIVGLTYLVNLVPADVLRQTSVHGKVEKLAAVREHLFAEPIFPVQPTFQFRPLDGPCTLSDGGKLTYFPLQHPGGSIGYRLDWPGHSMAYVTDTTAAPDADYVAHLCGVNLLLHEANFPVDVGNKPVITGHSTLEAAAEVATAAEVGHIVLVHPDPIIGDDRAFDVAAARRIFKNLELGVDRMEIEF